MRAPTDPQRPDQRPVSGGASARIGYRPQDPAVVLVVGADVELLAPVGRGHDDEALGLERIERGDEAWRFMQVDGRAIAAGDATGQSLAAAEASPRSDPAGGPRG